MVTCNAWFMASPSPANRSPAQKMALRDMAERMLVTASVTDGKMTGL